MAFLNKGLRITLTDESAPRRTSEDDDLDLDASRQKAKSLPSTALWCTSTTTACWTTSST